MYTIKQAAGRSGVSVPLLRAWERRYRIVEPARTAAGYRLYDDGALERLRTMRQLVDAGWTPSTAATAILAGEPIPNPNAAPPEVADRDQDDLDLRTGNDTSEAFVQAAVDLDAEGLERALDRMFALGSFEVIADNHLLPALVAVGDAWASGRLSVAGEHAASHAVLRRLGGAFQAAGRPPPPDGVILIGMPPTVRHELGAMAFSTAARRAGLPVLYLGPDLPVDDWVSTARRTRAVAAVIGAVIPNDVRPAVEVAAALGSALPRLTILFGGRNAARAGQALAADPRTSQTPAPARGLPLVLPEGLREAVQKLQDAVDIRD